MVQFNNNNNNVKRLWSGGYKISGSKLNLWIDSCSFLAAGKRAYSSQNTTFYLELVFIVILIIGVIVDIDKNLSKN